MATVNVQYFAMLREQASRDEETVTSEAGTVDALYAELQARHGFTLTSHDLRVAVDDEFVEWSTPLVDGTTIVFIPPMAGG